MIDLNYEKNCMSRRFAKKKEIIFKRKLEHYKVSYSSENIFDKVNQETILLSVVIQRHHKELIFDIIELITHDIILERS